MKKYRLQVGYGDYYWDLGEDEYFADTLEELWDEVPTNLTLDEVQTMLDEDGFAEDGDQMWNIIDTQCIKNSP
jgi:hypothetical protein